MTTRTLTRLDTTISFWDEGPRHAPMVLFLHGAALDHRAWDPQVGALRDRYRVVTVDLRTHGASPAPGGFRFDDAVADVVDLLEVLRPRHLALVGLSLGGNIAQEVVRRAPQRVDALVVADATCNTAPRRGLQKAAALTAIRYLALYPRWLFLQAAERVTAEDPAARDYVRTTTATMSQRDVVRVLTSLVSTALRPDPEYRLPVPTLILHGDRDRIGDIAARSERWVRGQPHAELAVIPSASHLSNLDAPEAFNRRLTEFLDRHLSARPAHGRGWAVHAGRRWRPRTPLREALRALLRRAGRDRAARERTRVCRG